MILASFTTRASAQLASPGRFSSESHLGLPSLWRCPPSLDSLGANNLSFRDESLP